MKVKMAGEEWLLSFLRCNPHLSIRTPEGTPMNRVKAFNRQAILKSYLTI